MPKPVRRLLGDATDRRQHPGVVGQRLPHPHEDDVGQPVAPLVAQRRRRAAHLLQDLRGRQVAGQSTLPGGAERARHAAARLRRDAHRVALRVAHQHRLERGAVDGPPQCLAGLTGVAGDLAGCGQQRREQCLGHLTADRYRQVGHLLRVGDQTAVVLMGQLLGAKGRQTQPRDGLGAAGLVEVGQVSGRQRTPRRFENQLLLHDSGDFSAAGSGRSKWRPPMVAPRPAGPSGRRGRAGSGPCP